MWLVGRPETWGARRYRTRKPVVCVVDISLAKFNKRPARESGEKGVRSVDQTLQLREHMALWNVIRLKGHWVHIIWGEAVDVLTRDGRSGETDGQVVAARRGVEWIAGNKTS
jgi:hypothetical protein